MSILDKAREAAAAAAEKTRELASSGVKAKELAQEAGAAVADGVSTTVEKARDLASDAGDAAKGIGSAIANATFVDSARELGVEEREQEAAQARDIIATAESKKG